jgi:hypothetical protein
VTHPPRLVTRIAIVGGQSYVQADLNAFLDALYEKHPYATVVTGSAMRSCEQHVAEYAFRLGFDVSIPDPNYTAFGDEAMDCQVNDVLIDADVIVTVGSKTGGRAKLAAESHKRIDSWREPQNQRVLHNVAAPEKTPTVKKRRATKKAEEYA